MLLFDSPEVTQILEAMGINPGSVHEVCIRMKRESPVSVEVNQFMTREQSDKLVEMIEAYRLSRFTEKVSGELAGPTANQRWYNPLEIPKMYPLELTDELHICLWSEGGDFKWTIAFWQRTEEGPEVRFVGNRPLDPRVNWTHLQEIIKQGQTLAEHRWKASKQQST